MGPNFQRRSVLIFGGISFTLVILITLISPNGLLVNDVVDTIERHRWMHELWTKIEHKTLMNITLPGTHNSGNYDTMLRVVNPRCISDYMFKKYQRTEPTSKISQSQFDSRFVPWNINHDMSISSQLVNGVRYFHLKLCWIGRGDITMDKIFHQHRGYTSVSLGYIMDEILQFLEIYTHEFVMIGFNNLHQIADTDQFAALVSRYIHDHSDLNIITSKNLFAETIGSLREANRRIGFFVSDTTRDQEQIRSEEFLYENWDPAMSGGDLQAAKQWLLDDMQKYATRHDKYYVLQANPNQNEEAMFDDVSRDAGGSLRAWEAPFLRSVRDIIQTARKADPDIKLNSISSDFLGVSNVVRIALELNR